MVFTSRFARLGFALLHARLGACHRRPSACRASLTVCSRSLSPTHLKPSQPRFKPRFTPVPHTLADACVCYHVCLSLPSPYLPALSRSRSLRARVFTLARRSLDVSSARPPDSTATSRTCVRYLRAHRACFSHRRIVYTRRMQSISFRLSLLQFSHLSATSPSQEHFPSRDAQRPEFMWISFFPPTHVLPRTDGFSSTQLTTS